MCANSFILVLLDFVWYCYFQLSAIPFSFLIRFLYVTFREVCFLLMLIEWSREVGVSVWNFYQLYFSLFCCLTVFSVIYVWLSIYFLMYINGLFFDTLILSIRFVFLVLFLFCTQLVCVWKFVRLAVCKTENLKTIKHVCLKTVFIIFHKRLINSMI